MGTIKMLDELTIQKIAAGEIVERPASIVKELIENSLDANASSITVEIRDGGKSYIRITDDGDGISQEQLKLAFKRHSTSKLSKIDDLHRIMSFGFRGEALASISAIARTEVLTKTVGNPMGTHAFVEEGKVVKTEPVGCPEGTTMIISDMFYNVPVRANFLRSNMVEANHVSNIVYRLALGNPDVSFRYIRDNKVIFKTSKNNDLISNIYTLLGKDFSDGLVNFSHQDSDFSVYGYISNNKFYRSNRSHQYLYVNNRIVKNENIISIMNDGYKSIIPINKYPVYILFFTIDPKYIDVNIHPTKEEIKFINQEKINSKLESIINRTIKDALSIPKIKFKENADDKTKELPLLYDNNFMVNKELSQNNNANESPAKYVEEDSTKETNRDNYGLADIFDEFKIIGTLFYTYILIEDLTTNKLFIIDQHAAHEKVMYERFRQEYENEAVAIQNLLTPVLIELSNTEIQLVMENKNFFEQIGFIIEEFGANNVIIRGVPILFGEPEIKDLFLEIVDTIGSNIKHSYEVRLDKIIKLACVKSVKSGDELADIEIKALLKQLNNVKNPYTCPHGRPVIIEILKEDIDKEFKRII